MFSATAATERYLPRPTDAPRERFQARLEACAACPLRANQECRGLPATANRLITIMARSSAGRCPTGLWPDQTAPPRRPLPIWRHDAQSLPPHQLGPSFATEPLDLDPLPTHLVRNLICHVYPQTAGNRWRRTAEHLCAPGRRKLFNGRRIIAVARDHECDSLVDVKAAFAPLEAEFLEFENHSDLGEVLTLRPLLERVADPAGGLTFYCHAKGASWPESTHPAHEWADVMFAAALDFPGLIRRALSTAPICGSLRRTTSLAATISAWHYSGTFFWFRNDRIFSPAARGLWRHVEQQWGGSEAWPALQVPKQNSACLFLDDAGDLYDPNYWDTIIRPAFRAWRNARRQEPESCTP